MIQSFSVIVPVYNCERYIEKTLQSIEASIEYFLQHHSRGREVRSEIVVVNDASPDHTLDTVHRFVEQQSGFRTHYQVTSHFRSMGAGAARNTGVNVSTGEILFFCDGDDLFLPEHIYVCYRALNREIPIEPDCYPGSNSEVAGVKTKVHIQEHLHPHWKAAIENSLLINLCLRRECHEFVEGFPEAAVYKQIRGREDTAYLTWIEKFFKIFRANLETVEYIRYPGNSFDRQLSKFQTAPGDWSNEWSPQEKKLHAIAGKLEDERIRYLLTKLSQLDPKFTPHTLMAWQPLITDCLAQQNHHDAILFYEQAIAIDPTIASEHQTFLAGAYNNVGTALHQQGQLDQAIQYFQKAIALKPNFPETALAKIYFNLGMVQLDQNHLREALPLFQQAADADPGLLQAHFQRARTQYRLQVESKGYEFTQDWFSNNILVWNKYVLPYADRPNYHVLEIGSWEGRSTCWFLDHLLTHEGARIFCIDTFEGSLEHQDFDATYLQAIEARFDTNVVRTGAAHKVEKLVGRSREKLRSLPLSSYDLLYIDGSHQASDVLEDALLGWGLVKSGGLIIFDDYGFGYTQTPDQNPKHAIDAFLKLFHDKIRIHHKSYQVLIEKLID